MTFFSFDTILFKMKRHNVDNIDDDYSPPRKYRHIETISPTSFRLPFEVRKSLKQTLFSFFNFHMHGETNTASVTLPAILFTWALHCCNLDTGTRLASIFSANRYSTFEGEDYFCIDRVKIEKGNDAFIVPESLIYETAQYFNVPGFIIFSTKQNVVIVFTTCLENIETATLQILVIDRQTIKMKKCLARLTKETVLAQNLFLPTRPIAEIYGGDEQVQQFEIISLLPENYDHFPKRERIILERDIFCVQ